MNEQAAQAAEPPRRSPRRARWTWLRAEARLTWLAIWRGGLDMYQSDDLTYASSIAYYALLSLFPFFLLVLSILGSVTADTAQRLSILQFVLRYFPRQFDFVTTQLDAFQQGRFRLGVVGSLLLIWAAMGVFSAVTSAVNHAWGVEKQPSYFKHKLIAFLMLVAASVLLLAGLLLVSTINLVQAEWFAVVLDRTPGLIVMRHFAVQWATTFVFMLVVGLIFYFVPNARVRFRDVWVGAVVTGLAWRGALFGFSWYVRDMTRFSNINGSIAAVIVFLVWVYTSAVILLYGAEVTAANARLRRRRPDEIPAAPTPRL
ncbi:MAG TPA: YihY/virulence factor BrkB family protein [Vicinamibacterales bacterium]|nr:YihY/virulence factor BrkB family protein [Vicinamibacterales bacterium]